MRNSARGQQHDAVYVRTKRCFCNCFTLNVNTKSPPCLFTTAISSNSFKHPHTMFLFLCLVSFFDCSKQSLKQLLHPSILPSTHPPVHPPVHPPRTRLFYCQKLYHFCALIHQSHFKLLTFFTFLK